ncbi:MAG TPA: hypothetical protein VK815_13750 [Candidatus Acidoferrales bacterium]|jgi:hypothetical protein|nr:hypothetical protein [Candidatus Acidoferrales bacterium]
MGTLKKILLLGLAILLVDINSSARTVPDPNDPTGFFTTVADKLLRSTFSFGITNIPVQTNGVFVYTLAVQRLLQVTANLLDASTTNFYPTVFRPVFFRDPQGNVFITGYQQVVSVTGVGDPQLSSPIDLTPLPFGVSSNVNVYGVPWIIGAKKYMPNFNEFYAFNTAQVTRKLQFNRTAATFGAGWTGPNKQLYSTNQMLNLSITNHMGFSFWNSYTANYPGQPVVYAQDFIVMRLSYGFWSYSWATNFTFFSSLNPWVGSGWNTSQSPRKFNNSGSFIAGNFDFPFVHEASLDLDQNGNPQNTGFKTETFIGAPTTLPVFPSFEEDTTNRFQAYILDNGHVLDYVQFYGPVQVRNLGDDLRDPNAISTDRYMWATNASGVGSPPTGVNWGVQHQITVSQTALNIPPGAWQDSPNMPPGLQGIRAAEAAMFQGFFLPFWSYGGKVYFNTNLAQQAPYIPIRTVVSPTLWVANDPLVHYLSSDLCQPVNELSNVTNGVARSDDPAFPPVAYPNLGIVPSRYQPWGRNGQMEGVVGVLHNSTGNASFNLAYRDPLVWGSDDWDFPTTNSLPLTTLGRIHRGTPWQTIYLKATNILDYVDWAQDNPTVGLNTWENWTGDFDSTDAAVLAPTSDWQLAALIIAMFNTNDATQLQSVNATSAGLSQALDNTVVQTNSTDVPVYNLPPQLDSFVMASNSPQSQFVANALTQARLSRANQSFSSTGDILATPELSISSPWLNRNDSVSSNDQLNYGISDEAYEAIPSQLLPRLRPDSLVALVFTNGGWSVRFSGSDAYAYQLQASTNLVDWETVGTNQPVSGTFDFPVATPAGPAQKFYRSVLLP